MYSKIEKTLRNNFKSETPIWFMRQAGRHLPEFQELRKIQPNFMKFCKTPDLTVEATLQPLNRYDIDAVIIFADILLIPDALGLKVEFIEGIGPTLETIEDHNHFSKLNFDHFDESLSTTYEAIDRITSELPEHIPLIGFSGAPWTLLSYMVEGKTTKNYAKSIHFILSNPDKFSHLMEILCLSIVRTLKSQIVAGAKVLQIFDSWASYLPASLFEVCIYESLKKILTEIKKDFPDIPVIFFPKGVHLDQLKKLETLPLECLCIDSSINPQSVHENLSPSLAIQGGIDPAFMITGGSSLKNEIDHYMQNFTERPYIFNLGHGILPSTPIENVKQAIKTVRAYR